MKKKLTTKQRKGFEQSTPIDEELTMANLNGLAVRLNTAIIRISSLETQIQEMASNQGKLLEVYNKDLLGIKDNLTELSDKISLKLSGKSNEVPTLEM